MQLTVIHYPDLLSLLGRGWSEADLSRGKVHTLGSRRWTVDVPEGPKLSKYTVWELKRRLEDDHGLNAEEMTVRFRGRTLDDSESLVSCGIICGQAVLLGLKTPEAESKPAEDNQAGNRTKTAESKGSLTQTVSCNQDEGNAESTASAAGVSGEPWWSSSRWSGPRGGGAQSAGSTWSSAPPGGSGAAPGQLSSAGEGGAGSSGVVPYTGDGIALGSGAALGSASGVTGSILIGSPASGGTSAPSPEELRRRRLARFG